MNRRDFFKLTPLAALAASLKPSAAPSVAQPRATPALPIQLGIKIVWGVPKDIKPVERDGIEGEMRLIFRAMKPGMAYFRTSTGIRCFILEDRGSRWIPRLEQWRRAHNPPRVLDNNKNL